MIPEHMQDKVVYISLASIYQFGKSICINPLQTHTEHEKYIRTAGCIDNLKQYFSDGLGSQARNNTAQYDKSSNFNS